MKKSNPVVSVVVGVVVLGAAVGLGWGIRKIRSGGGEVELKGDVSAKTAAESANEQNDDRKGRAVEIIEEEAVVVVQEPNEEVEVEAEAAEEVARAEAEEVGEAEPAAEQGQARQGFGDWRQMWASLNLTEEEQARLREGFMLAMQRWQSMSEEERQFETERMRAMGDRWANMSDEERQGAMERGRERFEEWRESGRVELPELTLD